MPSRHHKPSSNVSEESYDSQYHYGRPGTTFYDPITRKTTTVISTPSGKKFVREREPVSYKTLLLVLISNACG